MHRKGEGPQNQAVALILLVLKEWEQKERITSNKRLIRVRVGGSHRPNVLAATTVFQNRAL